MKPVRPELTSTTQTYIDLHRHAAVRAELLGRSGIALRLMVAHAIAGSPLWRIVVEPQSSRNDAVKESVDESRAEAVFDAARRAVLAILDLPDDEPAVTGGTGYGMRGTHRDLCRLFARLVELPDAVIMEVLTVVMGETLASGSAAVEAVGLEIGVPMADWWQADEAFLSSLRDREVLLAMVAEVAGDMVASANAKEKGKSLKGIIRDHLAGNGGREKREGWVPRWMAFPPAAYTARGGVGTVAAHGRAFAATDEDADPDEIAQKPDAQCHAKMEGEPEGEDESSEGELMPDPEPETDLEPGSDSGADGDGDGHNEGGRLAA